MQSRTLLLRATWFRVLALLAVFAGRVTPLAAESPKSITNSLGMKLLRIEPGKFMMGSEGGRPRTAEEFEHREYDESPAHAVNISTVFYLGATEVSNSQFEAFAPDHKAFRGRAEISPDDNDPVVYVSWQQAA